jgi:hypothetical protein
MCTIPSGLALSTAIKLNGRAEIKCSLVNGVNTLVKASAKS